MARRRVKTRFYALMTAFIIIIITVVVLVSNGGGGTTLENGYIETSMQTKAVVVRDEVCVSVEKHDRVIYDVAEGAQISEGDVIGSVFKWGYTDERMQSLVTVQKEILTEQHALLAGVTNSSLAALEAQIEQKMLAVRDTVMLGIGGDLLMLERELDDLLEQRRTLLKTLVQPSEKLTQLYESEEQQFNALNEWRAEISASQSGRVSFYFDGYEQVLNVAKLDMINSELLSTVLKNSSALSNNAESDNMLLYRIINPTEWYIAYLTDVSSAQRTVEGATYTVTFDGYESTPYTAVAASPKVNDKKIVNILKVSGDIGDFVGIRSISATISTTASGIKLSAGLLDMRDGAAYVNVIIGDAVKSVEVNILASDSEYAIVEAKNPNDVLSAGMRCKKP